MAVITRGYCRRHYNMHRAAGTLEMVGTGKKGGRPAGPRLAEPVPAGWEEGEEVPKTELQSLARKRMKHILMNPGAGQAEVNTVLRIIGGWDDDAPDEGKLEELKTIMNQSRLKAVDE